MLGRLAIHDGRTIARMGLRVQLAPVSVVRTPFSSNKGPSDGETGMSGYIRHDTPDNKPSSRKTGDEVEETAESPLGLAAEKIKTAVKTTATKIKEVLVDREDAIVNVGEEAYGSLDKFKQGIEMQAERGKEKIDGFKWQQDRHQRTIDTRGEGTQGGEERAKAQSKVGVDVMDGLTHEAEAGSEHMVEGVAQKLKHGVEGLADKLSHAKDSLADKAGARLQEGVQGMTEKLKSAADTLSEKSAQLEDRMQQAALKENREAVEADKRSKQAGSEETTEPWRGDQILGSRPGHTEESQGRSREALEADRRRKQDGSEQTVKPFTGDHLYPDPANPPRPNA